METPRTKQKKIIKYTPLRICGIVTLSLIGLFFLILIVIAIVRVLSASSNDQSVIGIGNIANNTMKNNTDCPHDLEIDLMVNAPIDITFDSIERNQKVHLEQGMSILVAQNTEQDGLYIIDIDLIPLRIDCIKTQVEYIIKNGSNKNRKYKHKQNIELENNLCRKIFTNSTNTSIPILIRDDMAQVDIYILEDVKELQLEFSNIYCKIKIVNQSTYSKVKLITKLQKQEWILESGCTYDATVCLNALLLGQPNRF